MKKVHVLFTVIPVIILLAGCEKEDRNTEYLYFPAGRSFLGKSDIQVVINGLRNPLTSIAAMP
jgi:hypothetical protein